MFLLLWILVGLIAGWAAGKGLEGEAYGPSVDIAMGITGALMGGSLMRSMGFSGYGGTILATLAALACAVLFTTLAALVSGRKIYTRQL